MENNSANKMRQLSPLLGCKNQSTSLYMSTKALGSLEAHILTDKNNVGVQEENLVLHEVLQSLEGRCREAEQTASQKALQVFLRA